VAVLIAVTGNWLIAGVQHSSSAGPRQVAAGLAAERPAKAILVPASDEGQMIAELASVEPVRSKTMLVRPSKLLARMNWTGTQYELLVPDLKSLTALFAQYPIEVIVLARHQGGIESPHETLLREMLASDPQWVLVRQYAEPGVEWSVYRKPGQSALPMAPLAAFMQGHLRSIP
jgi:hypothetical protein